MKLNPPSFLLLAIGTALSSAPHARAEAPANDQFATPTILVGDPADVDLFASGSNVDATLEAGEPSHAGSNGGASVWFRWRAPGDGTVTVDLAGSDFDTVLAVYTGNALGDLSPVVHNDDGDHDTGAGGPSKAVFNTTAGTIYQIAIDGYAVSGLPPSGDLMIRISATAPPGNDAFDSPIDLGSTLPILRSGDSHWDSTIEPGEPQHANTNSFGTTWYTWTAPEDGAVQIAATNTSSRRSVVAVYSGDSLDGLVEISTSHYGNGALLAASANTTYRIAVAGTYVSGAQTRGEITMALNRADAQPIPGLGFGDGWRWLHPLDATDPALADPDFDTTWQLADDQYDGPRFNPASPAPLGYGRIAAAVIQTDIGTPDGDRFGAYFVRPFHLDEPIQSGVVELLADDGAVIYIDGLEVGRLNVSGADGYTVLADDSNGTEARTYKVAVGAIAAGSHTLAVSLHNASTSSSDLGFDLRLLEGVAYNGDILLGPDPLCTGFEDPVLGAVNYLGRSGGDELGWNATAGETIETPGGERAFEITNLTAVRLETERIDVSAKTDLMAAFDLRAIDTSSGLEPSDFLHVYVEGSYDGLTFTPVADIFARLAGGKPDPFEPYRSDTDYTRFETAPGAIPDGLTSLRLVVEATADSSSEHLILDNFCLWAVVPKPRISQFEATPTGGITLTIEAQPGRIYELQSSPDLGQGSEWVPLLNELAEGETHTFEIEGPLRAKEMFYRVMDFGED